MSSTFSIFSRPLEGPLPLAPGLDNEVLMLNAMYGETESLFLTHDKRALRALGRYSAPHATLHGRLVRLEAVVLKQLTSYGAEFAAHWALRMEGATNLQNAARSPASFQSFLNDELSRLQQHCPARLWRA